jgi:hypothetical protein
VTSYLTRIPKVYDELAVIGDDVEKTELERKTIKGFSEKWNSFIKGVVSDEKLPDWNRL